jgi:D-3-phosphoglycerate dehydrogenase
MSKFKVYISDFDYDDTEIEKSILEPIGAEVIGLHCKTGEGLAELAADADVILQQYAKIPRSTIEKLHRCKGICRYGVGVDILDVNAAYEHGIIVTNVPDYCLDEVAEHTITLSLMLIRRIPMFVNATKAGKWHWSVSGGQVKKFRDITFGLVGFGRISHNVTRKIQAFGMNVISYDPFVSESFMNSFGVRKVDYDELLTESDVVALMCPLTKETYHIIDECSLKKMKKTAILINCSRGKLVDNKALYSALKEGWIASAAMDDLEEEPAKLDSWNPDMNPLFKLDNCFITPHVAYVSDASLKQCRKDAAENAKAILVGQIPMNQVFPSK